MDGIRLNNPGDLAVLADGLHLGGPWILRTAEVAGEVHLAGARIGGSLLWEETKIRWDDDRAELRLVKSA